MQHHPVYQTLDSWKVLYYKPGVFKQVSSGSFTLESTDRIAYTEDGTLISLYHNGRNWVTATRNKQNAKDSFYSARESFAELFSEVYPKRFYRTLDKGCTYTFVLVHVKNRIVIPYTSNHVTFLAKIDNKSGKRVQCTSEFFPLDRTKREVEVEYTSSNLLDYCTTMYRGLVITRYNAESDSFDQYMYDFPHYTELQKLRGNTRDIIQRYIELFTKDKLEDAVKLVNVYPDNLYDFTYTTSKMLETICNIYALHVTGHRNKRKEYSSILGKLRHLRLKNDGNNLSFEEVSKIVYSQKMQLLYSILTN